MNFRKTLHILVCVLLGLAGAGLLLFGPRANRDLPKDRVIIQYWEKWTGREGAQMKQIVDDFNNTVGREKGIYVQYLSMSGVHQKCLIATAAGVPPDVVGLWDWQVAQYSSLDAVEPLDDLAKEHGIGPDLYKPVYWKNCTYNGHLWALVSTPVVVALHYNKPAFEAAGLTRPPQTLDELDRYAKALTVRDSAGHLQRAGYVPQDPGWWIQYTPFWFGGEVFDPATQRFTLTDPRNVAAFEWVKSYSVELGAESLQEFRSGFGEFNSTQNSFIAGKVVMQQQGPFLANFIKNLKSSMQHDWAVAPFPSARPELKDVTYCSFDILMIPKGAAHKREAFEFMAYVQRQDVMEKLNLMHCKTSPLAKVSAEFARRHHEEGNPFIEEFERISASPNAHGCPQVPILPEVIDEMNVMSQKVSLLEQERAAVLRESQGRLEVIWEQYLAKQRARRGGVTAEAR